MSEFWKRKMRTYFHLFDLDQDGIISEQDWEAKVSRFIKSEKVDKQKAENMKTQFRNLWRQFMKEAVTNDKGRLTTAQFVDSNRKQIYNPELMKCISGVISCVFDAMDLNRDGYLQEDEHHRLFDNFGILDSSYTKETFREIDTNHDGKLSLDEFINACWDFWFSQDENSPNTHFFGPLVA